MKFKTSLFLASALLIAINLSALAQTAGTPGAGELIIATGQSTPATIVVSPEAGKVVEEEVTVGERKEKQKKTLRRWEKQAALDLQKYIEMMSGAKPKLADTSENITTALQSTAPVFIIGSEALKADSTLQAPLNKVAKKNPVLRADAIAVRRTGNRIYLAGLNDESHYHAVVHLLQQWGCRWYMPTEFGEVVPTHSRLTVGQIDYAYAPPFEVRQYWISWYGGEEGAEEFRMRNFMSSQFIAGASHALGYYTKALVPEGKSASNIPFTEPGLAEHVAKEIEDLYRKGEPSISVAIDDATYVNDSPTDNKLKAGIKDKFFWDATSQRTSVTDPMMVFYNNLAKILREKYPTSPTKLGGMAYGNVTIPPQWQYKPEPNLVMWLAPIDIDPNHGISDRRSPPRQEYGAMMYRWAEIMEGRLVIYDYDQGMLVWRDIPNPSHQAFQDDVQHYRRAGILGVGTESRNAIATTFLNLYFRGQLMWNPDANIDAMLADFYPKFYGPAAKPMADYWNAIFDAWKNTLTTEHEYMAAPAIYTPQLVARLKKNMTEAQAIIKPLATKTDATRNEKQYLERMTFTNLSFDIIENYIAMVNAAASDVEYSRAAASGEKALVARDKLTAMSPTFTTYSRPGLEAGTAWFPGEVQQYKDLAALTGGAKGTIITKTPLEWAFRRDPNDSGLASGWAYKPVDLSYWNANKTKYSVDTRKDYPTTQWEMIRTDLYPQAQGVLHPDWQSFSGHIWYRTEVELTAEQARGPVRLMFPGAFNSAWLYVNGHLVEHRVQDVMWWNNDYSFQWDANLAGKVRPGKNTITVRFHNPHHMGGLFRRPFMYQPKNTN